MKLSDIITPDKFRQLATYITICDSKTGTEVQDDLHKFADALEEMEAKNISLKQDVIKSVCPQCKHDIYYWHSSYKECINCGEEYIKGLCYR